MISDTNSMIDKVLIDEDSLNIRIKQLAKTINEYYTDSKGPLIMVGILKGSVMFMAELAKYVKVDTEMEFMSVSSYDGTTSTGDVKILKDLDTDIKDMNVLIVEDIIDTGHTLLNLKNNLLKRGPKDIKLVTLLDKPERRVVDIKADWYGFKIPNEFVVGFGLDYNQLMRNIPYIGVLKSSVYENEQN